MEVNLIVIKSCQIHELKKFYTLLGIDFEYHRHGKGVFHYAGKIGNCTFEIYPLPQNMEIENATNLRLGFKVSNLEALIQKMEHNNYKIIKFPYQTEFGYIATIEDLDGRKIDLTAK
jgi:predicted enzyme related to lactoylglutathione lyase